VAGLKRPVIWTMPDALATSLLCLSPIALTGAIGGVLSWARAFRRSFGAHRTLTGGSILVAGLFVLIHAGFYLAPLLYHSDHQTLALWLVLPVAVPACLLLVWHALFNSHAFTADTREHHPRNAMILAGLLATYLLPVTILILNLSR
jgi:hypothetical protein